MKQQACLQSNLDELKTHNQPVTDWLNSQTVNLEEIEKRLTRNRWGFLDWSLSSGRGMFESIPPNHFYKNWVVKEEEKTHAIIIVGCNLGYGLNYLLANTPDSNKVLVIEPRVEMLIACLSQTDYRPFLDMQKLFFLPPDVQTISNTIFKQLDLYFEFGQVLMRADIPSQQLGPDYAQWMKRCEEILDDFRLDMNTMRNLQSVMIQNELGNFNRTLHDGSLNQLKNQAKGLTAVLLGAGPSLEQFAATIVNHASNALFISAFQSLPALQKHRLKPHLCMVIDPSSGITKIIERLDSDWVKDIPLIYACKVLPELVDKYLGPTLPIWTIGGLGTIIWKGKELVLNDGANVGVALTRFLIWCGISKIMLVGQDFAWSGTKIHAAEDTENIDKFQFDTKRIRMLKNRQGEDIYSHAPYVTALRELEKTIRTLDIPVFNLYGGYAVIKGAKEVTWDEALSLNILDSTHGSLNHFLCKLNESEPLMQRPILEAQSAKWSVSINAIKKKIEKLFKKASKNQQEIYTTLNQLILLLNQDSLYRPYLLNEIFNIAGILFVQKRVGLKEFAQCKKILKQILSKVREIDQKLAPASRAIT